VRAWYNPNHNLTFEQALSLGYGAGGSALYNINLVSSTDPVLTPTSKVWTVLTSNRSWSGRLIAPNRQHSRWLAWELSRCFFFGARTNHTFHALNLNLSRNFLLVFLFLIPSLPIGPLLLC